MSRYNILLFTLFSLVFSIVALVVVIVSRNGEAEKAQAITQDYTYFQQTHQDYLSSGKQLIQAKASIDYHLATMTTNEPAHRPELTRLIMNAMDIRRNSRELIQEYNQQAIQVTNETFDGWKLPRRLEVLP